MSTQFFLVRNERYERYEEAKAAYKSYQGMPDVQVLMGFPEDGSYQVKVYEQKESEWVI